MSPAARILLKILLLLASGCAGSPAARAQVAELQAAGIQLSIDRNDVAVSGLSSGAAMAFQLHIAHSRDLAGAGLVAGPPYRCADYTLGRTPPVSSELTAINLCTAYYRRLPPIFTVPGLAGQPIELPRLVLLAENAFDGGKVDPLSGLCGDRVVLISGGADETVPPNVTDATQGLYETLMEGCREGPLPPGPVVARSVPGMPHTMPTDRAADESRCEGGPPFIADCDLPGAAYMLGFLHRREGRPQANRPADPGNLIRFDQHEAIGAREPKGLLHRFGYVYVPESCRSGAACGLHIALHGCRQNEDQINEGSRDPAHRYLFAADAGYNEFAERNGIVVLYPQAAATGALGGNPAGCWDWWGYNGPGYWHKDARQIRNLWTLVQSVMRTF